MVVDDLRPEIGAFQAADHPLRGNSPNLDEFARSAVTFRQAFASYGSCNPSRNSFLTGYRPTSLGLYNKKGLKDSRLLSHTPVTLPKLFRSKGYRTFGIGKLFHHERGGDFTAYRPLNSQNFDVCARSSDCTVHDQSKLVDEKVANMAIRFLSNHKHGRYKRPFFLALGFHRPHVAYSVPQWAFDNISEDEIMKLVSNDKSSSWYLHPEGIPSSTSLLFRSDFSSLSQVHNKRKRQLSAEQVAHEKIWYAAAVKWVDYCIGRVLDHLTQLEMDGNTIVAILGDHGVSTGEHGVFGKSNPFEEVAAAPLLVRVPHLPNTQGQHSFSPFELVHLGQTLIDLALPSETRETWGKDGISQRHLFEAIERHGDLGRSCFTCFALTTNARCRSQKSLIACEQLSKSRSPGLVHVLIFSLRTPSHRYVEFRSATMGKRSTSVATWSSKGLMDRQLFSHEEDDGQVHLDFSFHERRNLAPCLACEHSTVYGPHPEPMLPPLHGDDPYVQYEHHDLALLGDNSLLVAQLSQILRALVRDDVILCNGHGLPTSSGTCTCYQPWEGDECDITRLSEFPSAPTTVGPSESPSTQMPTISPSSGAPSYSPSTNPSTSPSTVPSHQPTLYPSTKYPTFRAVRKRRRRRGLESTE